jgi:hypothetical protein
LTDTHYEKGFSTKDSLNFYRLMAWLRIMPGTTFRSKDIEDFRKTLEEITTEDPA